MSEAYIKLEPIELRVKKIMPDCFFQKCILDSYYDMFIEGMIYDLKVIILGEKTKEEIVEHSFEYPKSFWDCFKEKFFPWFLKKRFPIKYKTIIKKTKVEHFACYPKLPILLPPEQKNYICLEKFSSLQSEVR